MAASQDKNTTITTKTVLGTTDPEVEIVAEVIKTPSKPQVEKQAPKKVGSTLSSSTDPDLTTTTPATTTITNPKLLRNWQRKRKALGQPLLI